MIAEPAPAKINLALHVRARRTDGYHDIETLFAFCAHGDVVTVAPSDTDSLTIQGPFAAALLSSPERGGGPPPQAVGEGLPPQATNLVSKAANAFRETFAIPQPHAIALEKNLPVASGIGGGSADAAATLRALARLHAIARDDSRLVAIARSLGADVPACLDGRATFGTGRGDALTVVAGLAGIPVLLVNPRVAVSTAAVFAGWDGVDRGAIGAGAPLDRARAGRNDLEPAARIIAPAIGAVRALLDEAPGAILSRMSGSGATCFALFDAAPTRDAAARAAATRGWWTLASTLA